MIWMMAKTNVRMADLIEWSETPAIPTQKELWSPTLATQWNKEENLRITAHQEKEDSFILSASSRSFPDFSSMFIYSSIHSTNTLESYIPGRIMDTRVVQMLSHVWLLWPQRLQHDQFPCPSLSPRVCSNSCPLSQWCHPTISSSVAPFPSCPQFFPASGSFQMSQFFTSGSQNIGASASA